MKALTIKEINEKKPPESRLTVIQFTETKKDKSRWRKMVKAKCICGIEKIYPLADITSGHSLSCGCFGKEQRIKSVKKYSFNIPGLYSSYSSMMRRCYDKNYNPYKYYGAKGVIVCEEWKNNYEAFLQWSLKNGWQKGLHLDKDKNGDGFLYSPNTCEWMTNHENSKYKSKNPAIMVEYKGKNMTLGEVCEIEKIKTNLVYGRIKMRGLTLEQALKLGNKKYTSWQIKKLLK